MISQLKVFKNRLSDFSGANKSIVQKRLRRNQDLDWSELNFLNGVSCFDLLKDLISGKESVVICKTSDPRDASTNLMSSKIRLIYRQTQLIFQERGTYDLKLGFPFVHGKFNSSQSLRCPLLFFNLNLSIENDSWTLKQTQSPNFNPVFLKAYCFHFQKKLIDFDVELEHNDYKAFIVKLIQLCEKINLQLRFSREIFEEKIHPFENFQKNELELKYDIGLMNVVNEAVLGLYPSSLAQLEKDYEWLIENNPFESIEHLFLSKQRDLKKFKEEHAIYPFDIDSSQEEALLKIKSGNSIVVQGPPGTGKSQLIANLMADCMANGMTALLVCDKKVALDVVYQRLQKKNLDQFLAVVHDYQIDKTSLFKKIAQNIHQIDEIKNSYGHFSTIQLERDFNFCSREIDNICNELQKHKSALFNEKKFGISPKELYLTCQKNSILLNPDYLENTTLENWLKLSTIANYWFQLQEKIIKTAPLWCERKAWPEHFVTTPSQVIDVVETWLHFFLDIPEPHRNINILHSTVQLHLEFAKIIQLLKHTELSHIVQSVHFNKTKLQSLSKWVAELKINIAHDLQILEKEAIIDAIKLLDLYHSQAHIKRFWIKTFNPELRKVEKLSTHLYGKNKLQKFHSELKRMKEFHDFCDNLEILEEQNRSIEHLENMLSDAKSLLNSVLNLKDWGFKKNDKPSFMLQNATFWNNTINKFTNIYPKCKAYFDDDILDNFNSPFCQSLTEQIEQSFDLIIEQNRIENSLNRNEIEILKTVFESQSEFSDFGKTVLNSIKLTAISILEKNHPELIGNINGKIDWLESELKRLMEIKMKISLEIAQFKAGEETYRDFKKNRLGNNITYRDLLHECEKKRKLLSIRQLVEKHFDSLKKIVPCWAVSPSTASAIFPIHQIFFDLVIFDEASQCFAEEALPIIFRAKQLVVVGDMKQLPPNTLYSMRDDNLELEDIDLQIDSWLALCQRYLPNLMLKGHYRSQQVELVSFSNQHFYDQKLQLIPEFEASKTKSNALKFVHIESGIWENNSNLAEAQWIVEHLINSLHTNQNNQSFGIITMNFHQQQLIWELLEEKASLLKINLNTDNFFIKNLENVQGDEADHIFISLAYARDKKGQVRANFGLLNQEQGANRLNVCITRAKKSMTLISSLLPHEIPFENAKNQGPKLLADFASFVFQYSNQVLNTIYQNPNTPIPTSYKVSLKNELLKLPNFRPSTFA
ncbi:MAG: AAA domain-containing protein, partial [Cytophagales bacterium]